MKKKYLLTLLPLLFFVKPALADDTDIYGVSTIDVTPNVLIIFDNSGSMSTEDVPADGYDPDVAYPDTGYSRYKLYYKSGSHWYQSSFNIDDDNDGTIEVDEGVNSPNWQCEEAKTSLNTNGYWYGSFQKNSGIIMCGSQSYNYRLGNFLNFDNSPTGGNRKRIVVAKEVIAKLINDNYDDVKFGLMNFNIYTSSDDHYEGGTMIEPCGASKTDLIGSYDGDNPPVFKNSDQSADYGAIGGMRATTYTPLAETMAEAGQYFGGARSWFNGTSGTYSYNCETYGGDNCLTYTSPVEYRCQKNYIILITDGEPTRDCNSKLANSTYMINKKLADVFDNTSSCVYGATSSGQSYLDDVTFFLQDQDLLPSLGEAGDFEYQNVTVYTIGFKQNLALLEDAATNGGGEYYTADNTSTLSEALNNIISAIGENNEGFSAASVPVSRANKAYAGNFVYYGLFQPLNSGNWIGNLKKYAITNSGVIQDQNGNDAATGGVIRDTAYSFWGTSGNPDGPSVNKGGAGEKLLDDIMNNSFIRKIYTYTGTDFDLTHSSNEFNTTNTGLSSSVISAVRHEDSSWPLGSFLHSQPLVVHYYNDLNDDNDNETIIYAGANDGMLHCFNDEDGSEEWGFIPTDLLASLSLLEAPDKLYYFVDGTPVMYAYDDDNNSATEDKKLLIVGERRGGYYYTALDISDYKTPKFKYTISPTVLGAGNELLGQSWGKPQLAGMGYMDGADYETKDVFVMVGGYDDNQDSDTPSATDSKGRAVFAIDSQTGALFRNFNFNFGNFSSMTHSIIAASSFENPSSRTTTRVYAGDLNGSMFAFRDDIFHRNLDSTQKDAFGGHYNGQEDGVWSQKLKLFSSPGKKIFYPPNIVNEYFLVSFTYPADEVEGDEDVVRNEKRIGDYVFYGTGDRAHPEREDIENRFYAIKNNWQWNDDSATTSIDESVNPVIVEAYVDENDGGKIKAKDDNRVLVGQQRDEHGDLTNVDGNGELFIIDVTDDLFQNNETEEATRKLYTNYVTDAINRENNRGWFLRFVEGDGSMVGEKIVSSPIIFGGVIYFTTYIPEQEDEIDDSDPCANPGARGTGYLYAIGYKHGEAIMDLDEDTPGKHRNDRKKKLKVPGIPPEPVIVIHEGKPTIITGFNTDDPEFSQSIERFYWKQINQ